MAGRLCKLTTGLTLGLSLALSGALQARSADLKYEANLQTIVQGSSTWAYYSYSASDRLASTSGNLPTRHFGQQCVYSHWDLYKINAVSHQRDYGIYMYDACNSEKQIFPRNQRICRNDDAFGPIAGPSFCVTLDPGTLPVGISTADCKALSIVSVALHADVSPPTYDPAYPPPLTATTSFADDFQQRLSEATCTDVLSWNVVGWTFRWSDGTVDHGGASGTEGTTDTHTPAAQSGGTDGSASASVTAIAHLHITGTAWDWGTDAGGTVIPVIVPRDTYVDISNDAAATGLLAPVYTPPVLSAGAIGISQIGDGTLPALDATLPISSHLTAVEGRLLQLYPRPIVVRAGSESIGGVVIGTSRSYLSAWTYNGARTDAPAKEATFPGDGGGEITPLSVQYNHAERLGPNGNPEDETVPVTLQIRNVYPDGTSEITTLPGVITVTIYYVGLNFEG